MSTDIQHDFDPCWNLICFPSSFFEQCRRKWLNRTAVFRSLSVLQSCGMMDCTHGRTRKRTRSARSRRRSPLLFLISFAAVLSLSHSSPHTDVLLKPMFCLFFLFFSSTSITALYCLHAARPGYPWRLDCNKKGILLKAEFVTWWMCPSCDLTFQVVSVSSLTGNGITGAPQGEGGW